MAHERLTWVDLAKLISICLVTSYHTEPPLTGYTAQLIQLLRMPAFFLIAGFLFDDRKFSSFGKLLIHRARQLLVPYICFEALFILLTSRSWPDIAQATSDALSGHPSVCFPLWFLICLFGIQVIHYIGIRFTERLSGRSWMKHKYYLLVTYIVICLLLSPIEMPMTWQLNAIVINLPFYAVANCCKHLVRRVSWRDGQHTATAACLMGGLLLIWIKTIWHENNEGWFGDAIFYLMHLSAGFLLLPPYIATCKAIGDRLGHVRFIEYLGSNTVVILALHTYFILVLSHSFKSLFGNAFLTEHAWLNPCLTICIVLAHYPIIWIINRWMPWMLGRARRTAVQ